MKKAIEYLLKELNLKDNDVIVIGNSAGPDSMALTNILLNIRKKLDIKIICAHVNHNVREESKEEEKFLKDYCQKNNITFERMIIEKYGDDNFHNEARTIRYNFFNDIVKKYDANYLMTAHHGDDLVETILMRITRGSTLKGYAGFSQEVEKDTYKIIRPLIYATKKEIEEYDIKNGIPYYIDKSNLKGKYTRNRYRKEVLPFLKEEDKNIHEKFLKFSKKLYEYNEFVEKETEKYYNEICKDNILDIDEYIDLDRLIQNKIISKMIEKNYSDDLFLINDMHIKLVQDMIISKKKNCIVNLPNNVVAIKNYNKLEIKPNNLETFEYEIELDNYVKLPNKHIIEKVESDSLNDNNICRINSEEISMPLYVRTRKYGDKMCLKKINGKRKIKDIFIDCKVDKSKRDTWPIVVDSKNKIIWIPGVKKSKFTKTKTEKYDIIYKYQ